MSVLADNRRTADVPGLARILGALHLDGLLLTGLAAIMLVVVVLPWVPATAIPKR